MFNVVKGYYQWLHGQWPAGTIEKLPLINADGSTAIAGVYVVGDLAGVPLLKFSSDTGAKAVGSIVQEASFSRRELKDGIVDLVIIGGGVSGYAAAFEAKKRGLSFTLIEASEAFSTISNFPKGKPIFTYPSDMTPEGELTLDQGVSVKESLLAHLQKKASDEDIAPRIASVTHVVKKGKLVEAVIDGEDNIQAHRAIIAIGRSGNFRQLDIVRYGFNFSKEGASGALIENVTDNLKEKIVNRLHDPKAYANQNVLVVGGGDSALESAIACAEAGANVTLSYRKQEFVRAKPENIEKLNRLATDQKLRIEMGTEVSKLSSTSVELRRESGDVGGNGDGDRKGIIQSESHQNEEHKGNRKIITIDNHVVLSMLGREAPLDFFRRSGIPISGESTAKGWLWFAAFFMFIIALYDWKNFGFLNSIWSLTNFPDQMPAFASEMGHWWEQKIQDRSSLISVIVTSMKSRSFYYTLVYTSCIGAFGWQRIKRRKTPYVRNQTITLFVVQLIPLFLLPEIFLPWLGYNGAFDSGLGQSIANTLFPSYISSADLVTHNWPEWGHPRAYWHAYGFILAWPLNVYNVFTPTPIMGWLIISGVQTFIIIPLIVLKWGKGAYCGWICSCGALAETLGDTQRHKMPHGPLWNSLNMIGQVILLVAFIMLVIRIGGWIFPETWMHTTFDLLLKGDNSEYKLVNPVSWKWTVDVLLGGILGVGLYFKYSGRVWCRFACPLAALMHIYARFSRFRIFANKDKCISCNACSSVCHQGIDVMNFANKGKPMSDPECVRCSACVQTCPTGVLSFGEINRNTGKIICTDKVAASSIQMAEFVEVKHVS